MVDIILTLKFFDSIDYLPTRASVLDFFITKDISKQYKRDEINEEIWKLAKSGKIVLFDDIYLGLPGWNFEEKLAAHMNRITDSKVILKKFKKYTKYFKFMKVVDLVGIYGKNSEKNFCILNSEFSRFDKLILKFLGIKDPIIIYTSNLKVENKNFKTAYYLLKMPIAYTKPGIYEKFIFKNPWIFDYFGNYPVDKISLNYKVVL